MKLISKIFLILLIGLSSIHASKASIAYRPSIHYGGEQSPELLIKQAQSIYKKQPLKAIDILTNALVLAIKADDLGSQIKAYKLLGEINFNIEQYSLSSVNFKKALDLIGRGRGLNSFDSKGFSGIQKDLYKLYGHSLEKESRFKEALEFYQLFLDSQPLSPKKEDRKFSSSKVSKIKNSGSSLSELEEVKLAMADIYAQMKSGDQSGNSNNGSDFQSEIMDTTFSLNPSLSNSSSFNYRASKILWKQGDSAALGYLGSSAEQAKSEGRPDIESQALNDIADFHEKNKDFLEAKSYRNKNIKILEKEMDSTALAANYLKLGINESQLGMQDSAKKSIEKAKELGREIGDLKIQQNSLKELAKLAEEKGNSEEALELFKQYVLYQDSAVSLKEKELDQKLIISEEYAKKQQQIDLLEKNEEINAKTIELLQESSKNQRILIYSLLAGLLLIFASSYLVYKNMRQRRLANQLIALRSLRAQMNPHFIFNALNSVNLYIAQKDERTANKYLTDFSRLMRLVLEQSQKDFIPLQQELEMIKLYINLEHDRFKDKFEYELNIDGELDEDSLQIPPMLIQPYIENAIWHGLRYKEDKGLLKIQYKLEGENILVRIEDNGIGRKKSGEIKTKNQRKTQSTGMYNIESRLRIINSMFNTKISLVVSDLNSDHGTRVEVVIPIQNSTNK